MSDHPHLDEIRQWEGYGSTRWVRPRDVVGIDYARAKALNQAVYIDGLDVEDESDDEVIVEYLSDLIKDPFVPKRVKSIEVVEAALFLIEHCWSVAAAERLGSCGGSLSADEVEECVAAIRDAHHSSSGFARKLVRSFAIDFLDYTGSDDFRYNRRLSRPLLSFLDSLLEEVATEG